MTARSPDIYTIGPRVWYWKDAAGKTHGPYRSRAKAEAAANARSGT